MNVEEKIAHLGFIQGAISRMAGNVFLVKGWTVALVAAMTALTPDSRVGSYISIVPTLLFWWLDAYYFRQEKLFRELYYAVADNGSVIPVFSLKTEAFEKSVKPMVCILFARTVCVFYILIFVLLALLATKGLLWGRSEREEKSQGVGTYIVLIPQISQTGELRGPANLFHEPK